MSGDDDEARLPTGLWVSAHLRRASVEGVPMMVLRKGDADRGTVLLKINRLDGWCWVLSQIRRHGRLVWSRSAGAPPIPEADADRAIERALRVDPDLWAIEIEDRQGRVWFDGEVV